MEFRIGESIKQLRQYFKITQKELSAGICDQTLISRIEKGETIPTALLLQKIADRFGVNILYFFNTSNTPRSDYVETVLLQIREAINKLNYSEALLLVKTEEKSPLFQTQENRQFLLWTKGVCIFYEQKKVDLSIELIHEALSLTKTTGKTKSEREIEILNSLGGVYIELGDIPKSLIIYKEIEEDIKKHRYIINSSVIVRVLYNYSKALTANSEYDKSNEICERAINICKKNHNMYLFGNLYFRKGFNYFELKKYQKSLDFMEKALTFFKLMDSDVYIEHVTKQIQDIKEEMSSKELG